MLSDEGLITTEAKAQPLQSRKTKGEAKSRSNLAKVFARRMAACMQMLGALLNDPINQH